MTGMQRKRQGAKWAICLRLVVCLTITHFALSESLAKEQSKVLPFTLIEGKGIPVCDAYLKRLNLSDFGALEKLPICGRPENSSVKGFDKLNRVPLTVEQIASLWGQKDNFISQGNSGRGNSLIRGEPSAHVPTEAINSYINSGLIVWRYDPPVDIDNDGDPDEDLIVWYGDLSPGPCGRHAGPSDSVTVHPTLIFSIDWQQMKLNEPRTRELFEHPIGGYPISKNGRLTGDYSNRYRPIGLTMGIFAFQREFYFDTFFDEWGGVEGSGKSKRADRKRRTKTNDLRDTLGVFQRKDSVTKQICEFRWNESKKYIQ